MTHDEFRANAIRNVEVVCFTTCNIVCDQMPDQHLRDNVTPICNIPPLKPCLQGYNK